MCVGKHTTAAKAQVPSQRVGQTITSPKRPCCSEATTQEPTSSDLPSLPQKPALQGRGARGGSVPEGSGSSVCADANPARLPSLSASRGANRAVTAIPQPQGPLSSSRSHHSLKNIQSIHKYSIASSFSKGKTLTTDLPTPARENSSLTGKAEGRPPFSVRL